MRNGFDPMYITKAHVILIPDGLQLVIHKNLHRNIHYSVSDNKFLKHLRSFCNFNDIKIAVYKEDRSYTKVENIIVINNFSSNLKKLCYSKLKPNETLDMIKKSGKNRAKSNTRGWSIAPSASYAKGWTQPNPELNQFCRNGKLNKEGYNTTFPSEMKEGLSFALFLASSQMKSLFDDTYQLFHDDERYNEFSNDLKMILGSKEKVFFEGGSVQANMNNFVPHIDIENCAELGYNYSSVLSTKINGTRVSWIGYNRKRAHMYMVRKREAIRRFNYTRQT